MMLVEETTVPLAALPVAQFKEHMRLGTGFADDAVQDAVLESFLRAAIAAVEARTGKMLIARDFSWTLTAWRDHATQPLPVAPVLAITSLEMTNKLGEVSVADAQTYDLRPDTHRPALVATGTGLPAIPSYGQADIQFTAGFGLEWSHVPADLAQAVMLLAAHYYQYRAETGLGEGCMPFGVSALLQRYRPVRVGMGAA